MPAPWKTFNSLCWVRKGGGMRMRAGSSPFNSLCWVRSMIDDGKLEIDEQPFNSLCWVLNDYTMPKWGEAWAFNSLCWVQTWKTKKFTTTLMLFQFPLLGS